MSSPQRFSKGVTNVTSDKTMGQLVIPDPTSVHVFMDDFNKFVPGDWFITRIHAGTTAGTETISDADGGILVITPATADDDSTYFQHKAYDNVSTASEIFTFEAGKKLYFKARFKVSDVTQSDFFVGLQSADTTPLTSPVDAAWFISDDGDANLDFGIYSSSVSLLADTGVATLANDTYFTVGFWADGVSGLHYFYNDVEVGDTTVSLPTAEMTISFGVRNGAAAAKVMSVDYICAIKTR